MMTAKKEFTIPPPPVIELRDVSKSYHVGFLMRRKRVLKNINLSVYPGEILGFLGPNGAGKTTTMKIINNLTLADKGEVYLFGQPNTEVSVKAKVGFLPEAPYFYNYLTGLELLEFYAQLFGIPSKERRKQIKHLLNLVKLERAADLQMRKYSRGMLQRIGMAQVLINDPDLLILDEPISSLDPVGRREFRNLLLKLKEDGKTIFFSTHILSDVELICDRVAIIMDGEIIREGKMAKLIKERIEYYEIALAGIVEKELPTSFEKVSIENDKILVRVRGERGLNRAIELVTDKKGRIISINPEKKPLEDILFAELGETGK
jgi:ABC-2 type transport system ATP-binding protein